MADKPSTPPDSPELVRSPVSNMRTHANVSGADLQKVTDMSTEEESHNLGKAATLLQNVAFKGRAIGTETSKEKIVLNKEDVDFIIEHMELSYLSQKYTNSEMSNVQNLQDKTKEVQGVVKSNLNKALDRDQALGDIEQRADRMHEQAGVFQKQAIRLKRKTCWDNYKMLLILLCVIGAVVIGVVVLLLIIIIGAPINIANTIALLQSSDLMGVTEEGGYKINAKLRGPGPARYALPNTSGFFGHDATKTRLPAYSFGLRTTLLYRKTKTPGPAHFIDASMSRFGKEGSSKFSLKSRNLMGKQFQTPAPNAYNAERIRPQREPNAPSYSMGTRNRMRKADSVPSPNSYSLPSLIGPRIVNKDASSAFTMTNRASVGAFDEDLARTPGPGHYSITQTDIYKSKRPVYSLQGRSFIPGDTAQKPGPGAHSPEKVDMSKRRMPAYSMGVRHSEYLCPLIVDAVY
ncbi:vesicle-associated membrane protein 2-like [Oopsacas minuta]|uniref:Vesicle-associated membrane protein 2-like n=1 Tax=Oopsacas minuta TaxID=111878 RepID=A0AAV7JWF1_9METZ|nr:vesicle-associated membrane protein 2-like [Oopsacas minuta]